MTIVEGPPAQVPMVVRQFGSQLLPSGAGAQVEETASLFQYWVVGEPMFSGVDAGNVRLKPDVAPPA